MTTSQKHQSFISEPMGEKPSTDLAGIGEVLGKRLAAKGYDKVSVSRICRGLPVMTQYSFPS